MKRIFIFISALMLSVASFASPPVQEMGLYPCTDAFSVALTTFSWTLVPTAQCSGRTLVVLTDKSTNSSNMIGIVTTSSAAPSVATTTVSIELVHGGGDTARGLSEESFLWMMSLNSSAESVTGQEFKQR